MSTDKQSAETTGRAKLGTCYINDTTPHEKDVCAVKDSWKPIEAESSAPSEYICEICGKPIYQAVWCAGLTGISHVECFDKLRAGASTGGTQPAQDALGELEAIISDLRKQLNDCNAAYLRQAGSVPDATQSDAQPVTFEDFWNSRREIFGGYVEDRCRETWNAARNAPQFDLVQIVEDMVLPLLEADNECRGVCAVLKRALAGRMSGSAAPAKQDVLVERALLRGIWQFMNRRFDNDRLANYQTHFQREIEEVLGEKPSGAVESSAAPQDSTGVSSVSAKEEKED